MNRSRHPDPESRRREGDLTPLREIRPGPLGPRLARWWAARAAWADVIGVELARRLVFLRAEGETWIIAVSSASWAAELGRLEGKLLNRLATRPEIGAVRHLRGVVRSEPRAGTAPDARREATRLEPQGDARERLEELARRLLAARSGESS
jgi:hypothetical protein